MRTSDLAELLETMIKEQINITPCLWGSTGIGKSSVPKQVARKLGYKVYDIRLSQLESVDLKGMPFTQFMTTELSKAEVMEEISRMKSFKRKKDRMEALGIETSGMTKENMKDYFDKIPEYSEHQVGTLHHYSPDWFITALQEGKCIIFLDELNRARQDVLQAAFELVLDRTINNQKLPDDVFILTACNPSTANYDTNALEDDALKARFMHLQVKSNTEDWLTWAGEYTDDAKSNKRVHPNVLTYILETPADLNAKKSEEDGSLEDWIGEIHPVPRRWELVSVLEQKAAKLSDQILSECFNGLLGSKVGTKYWSVRKTTERPISLKDLLEWSKETKEKVARYSGISDVKAIDSKKRGAKKVDDMAIRLDLINETVKDIMNNWALVLKSNPKAVVEFLTIIPKDSVTKVLKDVIMKEVEFKSNAELGKDYDNFLSLIGKEPEIVSALERLVALEK